MEIHIIESLAFQICEGVFPTACITSRKHDRNTLFRQLANNFQAYTLVGSRHHGHRLARPPPERKPLKPPFPTLKRIFESKKHIHTNTQPNIISLPNQIKSPHKRPKME